MTIATPDQAQRMRLLRDEILFVAKKQKTLTQVLLAEWRDTVRSVALQSRWHSSVSTYRRLLRCVYTLNEITVKQSPRALEALASEIANLARLLNSMQDGNIVLPPPFPEPPGHRESQVRYGEKAYYQPAYLHRSPHAAFYPDLDNPPSRIIEGPPLRESQAESRELARTQYRVWFGTDRHTWSDEYGTSLDDGWSTDLTLGSCIVNVPRSHTFGSIGSPWLKRKIKGILGFKDDTLTLLRTVTSTAVDFSMQIESELKRWPRKTALVYVHGYNVSFVDAAIRSAQIGFDLKVEGITAFFSWPSQGRTISFAHDEANIELSEKHFIEFIVRLSKIAGLDEINLLAHSMGNRLLCRVVPKLLELQIQGALKAPVGQVMLAAADLTSDFFRQYADLYLKLAGRRVTNYTHRMDIALLASRGLHGVPRVGLEPPIFVHPGLDTISVSMLDLDIIGHGYVANAAPLLYDMAELIHYNMPPSQRTRILRGDPSQGPHWIIGR